MKSKNAIMIAAAVTMFATAQTQAQDTITVPPGRTVIEVAPGQPSVEVVPSEPIVAPAPPAVEVAPEEHIVTEPAGAAPSWSERFHYEEDDSDLFPDQEFTIDLFGSYTDGKEKFNDLFDTNLRDGDWGGGIGMNYFFTKMLGIGADAFAQDNGGPFVDAANASLILRMPIDIAHLAPYIFGGGGYQFQGRESWTAHAGAGLEIRLNQHTGIFADARYVFPEKENVAEYGLFRAGLRLAF